METIILEPKNKEELDALKRTIKRMGIRSYSISSSNKKYLTRLKEVDAENNEFKDPDIEKLTNKEERVQLARYKLATLSKRNQKATASMELINEVLQDVRKSNNAKKKR